MYAQRLAALLLAAATLLLLLAQPSGAKSFSEMRARHDKHRAAMYERQQRDQLASRDADNKKKYRFLTDKTAPFQVHSLPDVPYDVGEMYSGLIPINKNDTKRELFFVFEPTIGDSVDEVTIWLNGGPGCSSLEGFFQENGRFTWQPGTYAPVENAYSWVNLTNVLWVEQPVGTGFSTGTPTADSEEQIAQDFVHFFKNFQDIFGIKNFKIFVTGESYAGRYVPYISAAMLNQKDKTYYDLTGALVYDPCIGEFDYIQAQVPAVQNVVLNPNLFNFNASFMSHIQDASKSCGYDAYFDKYFKFPPAGVQPTTSFNASKTPQCDLADMIESAVLENNPCWDVYAINQACPILWDVLGFPGTLAYEPSPVYFNRTDVKKAMHAPLDTNWAECASKPVFTGGNAGPQGEGDISADPIQHVLPQVIEATNRVLVSNGNYDFIIITNGTLLAIQNMTWNGNLGFQSRPSTLTEIDLPDLQYAPLFDDENLNPGYAGLDAPDQGVMGIHHYERGLMWAETFQSGHMQPQYQPRSSYKHLQWVLGRIKDL